MFGFKLIKEKEINALKEQVAKLEQSNQNLQMKIDLVPIDLLDPAPADSQTRSEYMARVAGFYFDILEPKLKQMISSSYAVLEGENTPEQDNLLKGTIFALREIMRWGENCLNEHKAKYIEPDEDEEEADTLQEDIKKLLV